MEERAGPEIANETGIEQENFKEENKAPDQKNWELSKGTSRTGEGNKAQDQERKELSKRTSRTWCDENKSKDQKT